MTDPLPYSHPFRVADLAARKPTAFDLVPTASELAAIAGAVGADQVRKLRFAGTLTPFGQFDWRLQGRLGATVVQPCVVTLAPVTTRIEEMVTRTYQRDLPEPQETEVEVPEDDTLERLGAVIDVGAVLIEALTLALPVYPRAPGAAYVEASFAEPGAEPVPETVRPFAGLRDILAAGKPGDADETG